MMPPTPADDATLEMAGATISEHDGVRYLHLGSPWVQGAMWIRKPQVIVLAYVQRMMASLLWRPTEALCSGHAVQLGLGAGAITRFTAGVMRMRTTAVELNPTVIAACRLWFKLPADGPLLEVVQADAGTWVQDPAQAGRAQMLWVDLYDHEAAAPVLDDLRFYAACHAALDPAGGVLSVNLFGRRADLGASAARIAQVFGADRVWTLQPTREGNTVVIAARGADLPERAERLHRAAEIERRFGLPARKWLRMIRPWQASQSA